MNAPVEKKEQWEQPDREAVIRDNPLLEYCQRWRLKRDGSASRYKCLCPLPGHKEKTPSFTIFADDHFHCYGCGEHGSVIDLHMALMGMTGIEALCDLAGVEYHGGKKAGSAEKNNTARSQSSNAEPYDPLKDPLKARKRQGWPVFELPTSAEIESIATLRGLSPEGITLAAERGLLFCADSHEGRAWIITDSRRKNAQARRLDGKYGNKKTPRHGPCPAASAHCPSVFTKPVTFQISLSSRAGRTSSQPFILRGAQPPPRNPRARKRHRRDREPRRRRNAGGPPILEGELRHFKDKCVRIFADADKPGLEAEGRWWNQLEGEGAKVDGYSFDGFSGATGGRSRISMISRSSTPTSGRRSGTPSRRHSHFQT